MCVGNLWCRIEMVDRDKIGGAGDKAENISKGQSTEGHCCMSLRLNLS